VLSILDPSEPELSVFGSFGEHERVELRFDDVIEESPDLVAPHRRDVEAILAFGRQPECRAIGCHGKALVAVARATPIYRGCRSTSDG
jgi:hypothetical protein